MKRFPVRVEFEGVSSTRTLGNCATWKKKSEKFSGYKEKESRIAGHFYFGTKIEIICCGARYRRNSVELDRTLPDLLQNSIYFQLFLTKKIRWAFTSTKFSLKFVLENFPNLKRPGKSRWGRIGRQRKTKTKIGSLAF